MATIRSFEELEMWKKARVLAEIIYEISNKSSFNLDFSLKNQINNSSGSIMDNIAEGFERGGTKEFILFLSYARGSAGEVRSQLYRALDRKHIDDKKFEELKGIAEEIGKMISGFIIYLQRTDFKGTKYLKEPDVSYQ